MTYEAPKHIILRRRTSAISDGDLVALERALQHQLNDAGQAYGLPPPGVSLATPETHLPGAEAVAIDFVDDDGLEAAIAHHGWNERANFAWCLIGVKEAWSYERAASHEALEYFLNLKLDQYEAGPGGLWPREICDPVESQGYPMRIEVWGEIRRSVELSNFVLPSFWQSDGRWPYDYLGMLEAPFSLAPGGYAVVEGRDGQRTALGGGARRGSSAKARASSRAAWLLGAPTGRQP